MASPAHAESRSLARRQFLARAGAGLVFKVRQSTGGMTSLNYNGTELQPSGTNESHVESGLPSPTVSARQTGN
jgi:rhamnogalacturonan endolyase